MTGESELERRMGEFDRLYPTKGITRRDWLKGAGVGVGAIVAGPVLLAACGDDDDGTTPAGDDGTATTTTAEPDAVPVGGGEAKVGFFANFQSFDPPVATTVASLGATTHVIEALLDIDSASREIRPGLVDFPEKIDDMTYRIKIRDGALFHNGDPVTPEDVVFSLDRTLNMDGTFYGQFIPFISGATIVDGSTLDINLNVASGFINEGLTFIKVVPKSVVEADQDAFATLPTGSGPYRMVEATDNSKILLEKFEDYNGPRTASLDTIDVLIQTDASARVSALRARETIAAVDIPDRDIETVRGADGLEVDSVPGFLMSFLMFNCVKYPDKRVRQALHYAIDRDTIQEIAYLGNAEVPDSYLPRHHPNHVTVDQQYPYDPERARALLAEAGAEGLSFTLNTWTANTWNADAANIIQQNWADIGVNVEQKAGGESLYESVFDASYEVQLAIADQSTFGWDANTLLAWHYGPNWNANLTHWQSPEQQQIEQLLSDAIAASGDEQFDLYAQVQNLVAVEVPIYVVHHRTVATGWSSDAFSKFSSASTAIADLRDAELA